MTPYSPRAAVFSPDVPPVSAATLPLELRQVIDRVLKRARLWPRERADVESELAAHFADGLASGVSLQRLIEDFGDPAAAAGLIRRAKIRNRSRAWHAWWFARTIALCAAAMVVLFFASVAIRYHTGAPTISRDIRKEINASLASIPREQRAWPTYKHAYAEVVNPPGEKEVDDAGRRHPPMDAFDSPAAARINQPAIALLRQAAAFPKLGLVVGDLDDETFLARNQLRLLGQKNWKTEEIPIPDSGPNASVIETRLLHLGLFRNFLRLLMQDVDLAVEAGNAEIVSADLIAAGRMAIHLREGPFLISDLVSLAIWDAITTKVREVLTVAPSLLTDNALIQIAQTLESMGSREALVRFDSELLCFDDTLQRTFTDDGNGDGRLTPEGIRFLSSLFQSSGPDQREKSNTAYFPSLTATFGPGRKALRLQYQDMIKSAQEWGAISPWSRPAPPEFARVASLPISPYSVLSILVPSLHSAIQTGDRADASRQALLTTIAVERFKRANGRLPETLAELVPAFLLTLPIDFADGRPLRYKLIGDSYVLYSLGADKKDDGGTLPPTDAAAIGISNFNWPIDAAKANYDWVFFPFVKLPKEQPKP